MADVLKRLYDSTDFRTPEQQLAVETIANSNEGVIIQLPTGSGKSLTISLPAFCSHDIVTLVVVPYNILRRSLVAYCQSHGLGAAFWTVHDPTRTPVVLVTPELFCNNAFRTYFSDLARHQRLRRVIINECHLLVTDVLQ